MEIQKKVKKRKRIVVDYTNDPSGLEAVEKLLKEANDRPHGREVIAKDLVGYALGKIGPKDIQKIRSLTLGEMDKVRLLLERHNAKNGTQLTLGEFLVKQLKI